MRACLVGGPEQLKYIGSSISDMDAAFGCGQQISCLFKILQPPNAFLFFDGNSRWIDMPLELIGTFKLISSPKLDRCDPQRQALSCDDQARMHQYSTYLVMPRPRHTANC